MATHERPQGDTRLVEAAIDLFASVGYHGTTTRDIAERAGMSPAAVYVHFPSKLELLERISRVGHDDARRCLEEALAAEGTHDERVANGIREFARWHAENQTIARVVQYEYRALPPEARAGIKFLRRQMQKDVENAVRRGVEAGRFNVEDAAGAALAIVSMCVDIARWYSPNERRSPTELGDLYADLALKMLGAEVEVHPMTTAA